MTAIERARMYLDDPSADQKYSDDAITRFYLYPALEEVTSRVQMQSANGVICRMSFTPDGSTEYYQLPSSVQQVVRLARLNENNQVTTEWVPRGERNLCGPVWALEGNTLALRPFPTETEDIDLWYRPSGDILAHYSADGGTINSETTFTLSAAPTLGDVDYRENAYAGCQLRVIENGNVDERVIDSYNETTRQVILRTPLTNSSGSGVAYEVVGPVGGQSFYKAVSLNMALDWGAASGLSGTREVQLGRQYKNALKTICDKTSNMQGRTGNSFEHGSVDSPSIWNL